MTIASLQEIPLESLWILVPLLAVFLGLMLRVRHLDTSRPPTRTTRPSQH